MKDDDVTTRVVGAWRFPFRLVLMGAFTLGAVVYAAWTQGGWLAGIGTAAGLLVMLAAIFRSGRPRGSALQEMREQVAKRWTCKKCGTRAKPKSISCLSCGTNF